MGGALAPRGGERADFTWAVTVSGACFAAAVAAVAGDASMEGECGSEDGRLAWSSIALFTATFCGDTAQALTTGFVADDFGSSAGAATAAEPRALAARATGFVAAVVGSVGTETATGTAVVLAFAEDSS
jgi:hypothetical protein